MSTSGRSAFAWSSFDDKGIVSMTTLRPLSVLTRSLPRYYSQGCRPCWAMEAPSTGPFAEGEVSIWANRSLSTLPGRNTLFQFLVILQYLPGITRIEPGRHRQGDHVQRKSIDVPYVGKLAPLRLFVDLLDVFPDQLEGEAISRHVRDPRAPSPTVRSRTCPTGRAGTGPGRVGAADF